MNKNLNFMKGTIVPILTPIDENEKIDEAKLREQVDFVINGGVLGILAFGSNGEFYMVEEDDYISATKIMLDQAAGRVPVYMGIGAINTRKCIRLAKKAKELGVAGISVLQPMFLKPSEEELYTHFKAIADSVPDLPMLLYNNPGRTGYTMSGDLVEKLAHEVDNIVGMKDSSGDMTQTEEFIRRNRDIGFRVFGGKDTLIFGALVHGAAGCVATTANFAPELVTSIYDKYQAGDIEGAREAQFKLNPLRLSMDKASFPVATKDLANLIGRNIGKPYTPNFPSSGSVLETMKSELSKVN
jgi:4-hydroxy-tetrahydrodipicolinate synthase